MGAARGYLNALAMLLVAGCSADGAMSDPAASNASASAGAGDSHTGAGTGEAGAASPRDAGADRDDAAGGAGPTDDAAVRETCDAGAPRTGLSSDFRTWLDAHGYGADD